jgi:DNA repair protein RecN (Recombination protein N)
MDGAVSKKGGSQRSLLQEISIRGLGVIDNAIVEFKPGLNVITGETGAGKTMLLTALSLILGGKADSDLVRTGQERLSTSGRFLIPQSPSVTLKECIDNNDIAVEEGAILLNRNLSKDGKSRAILSGINTTAAILSEVGAELIEIHGQHATHVLSKSTKQREILDSYCMDSIKSQLMLYRELLTEYQELKKQISELLKAVQDKQRLIQELKELDAEFRKIKPSPGELSELDNLIRKLESVEELRVASTGALESLSQEEQGALNSLQHSKRYLSAAKGKDKVLDELHDRVSDSLFNLLDATRDLELYLEGLAADPLSLDNALQRRSMLTGFAKKYGDSSERVAAYEEAIKKGQLAGEKMENLDGGELRIAELSKKTEAVRTVLLDIAKQISQTRILAGKDFAKAVTTELHSLSMPRAEIRVAINSRNGELDSDFQTHGLDEVTLEFSAHGGSELLPIAKAASGGELSRLMLGIEVVIAENYPVGTYIFDEVDAGVGGKAALDVGRRLKALSQNAQVIVVTHLPQVALWADHHIKVEKNESGAVTTSTIRAISDQERELEIARMLSGLEGSEHAQEHARELLNLRINENP